MYICCFLFSDVGGFICFTLPNIWPRKWLLILNYVGFVNFCVAILVCSVILSMRMKFFLIKILNKTENCMLWFLGVLIRYSDLISVLWFLAIYLHVLISWPECSVEFSCSGLCWYCFYCHQRWHYAGLFSILNFSYVLSL